VAVLLIFTTDSRLPAGIQQVMMAHLPSFFASLRQAWPCAVNKNILLMHCMAVFSSEPFPSRQDFSVYLPSLSPGRENQLHSSPGVNNAIAQNTIYSICTSITDSLLIN